MLTPQYHLCLLIINGFRVCELKVYKLKKCQKIIHSKKSKMIVNNQIYKIKFQTTGS